MNNKQPQHAPKTATPTLRFPEFETAPPWEVKPLKKYAKIVRGGSPRPINEYLTTDSEGLHWLKIGDVHKEAKFITQTAEKVIPEALTKTRVVKHGDLIMSNSMSFGRPYIVELETCIHDGWIAISEIKPSLYSEFLYYLILSDSSQKYFLNTAAGSGVRNLNIEIVGELSTFLTNLPEQQKIADCLSSLDEVITAQTEKVAALKQHKKGLMQALFPAEDENVPSLRFPEFENAPPWEMKRLRDLVYYINGKSLEPYVSESGFYKLITLNSIDITGKLKNNHLKVMTSDGSLIKDDLVMVLSDVAHGNFLGLVDIIPDNSYVLNQRMGCLRIKNTDIIPTFLKTLINYNQKYFKLHGQGSSQKNLSKEAVLNFPVILPRPDEQQKIADCLSSLDEVITAQTEKIAALKQHKKGLMQALFPALDEEVAG
jgi:type I restriction enzyme S subunit